MTLRAKRTRARQHIFSITILEKEAESYEKSSDRCSTCMCRVSSIRIYIKAKMPVEALYSFAFTLAGPVISHFTTMILATYISPFHLSNQVACCWHRCAFPYTPSPLAAFIIEGPGAL